MGPVVPEEETTEDEANFGETEPMIGPEGFEGPPAVEPNPPVESGPEGPKGLEGPPAVDPIDVLEVIQEPLETEVDKEPEPVNKPSLIQRIINFFKRIFS